MKKVQLGRVGGIPLLLVQIDLSDQDEFTYYLRKDCEIEVGKTYQIPGYFVGLLMKSVFLILGSNSFTPLVPTFFA